MKLLKSLLVVGLLLAGCATTTDQQQPEEMPIVENEVLKVLSPTGAPALALAEVADQGKHEVNFVTGSEALQAEFVKADGEYDVIFAPVNLGAKLAGSGKSDYRLAAIITWGNIYLVGTGEDALSQEGSFAAFGENSVPDVVFKNTVDVASIVPEITYYSSAQDVQAALLSNKANCGLLAEPAVTATIAKAKEAGIELKVIKDLQVAYQERLNNGDFGEKIDSIYPGFPQAAIFVKQGSEEASKTLLKNVEQFVNVTCVEQPEMIATLSERVGVDTLGVPSAAIAQKTFAKQNIHYVDAKECQDEVKVLLSLFSIDYTEDILVK